jgi:hypothetical protein
VVVDHRGLDRLKKLADLVDVVPVREPIRVGVRRIAREEIPVDPDGQARWLDDLWLSMDAELSHPVTAKPDGSTICGFQWTLSCSCPQPQRTAARAASPPRCRH